MRRSMLIFISINLLMLAVFTSSNSAGAESMLAEIPECKPEMIFHHYADPSGDIVAYMCMPDISELIESNGEMEKGTVYLTGIPSGEKFIEYECINSIVLFSPDGRYAAKVIPRELSGKGDFDIALCSTADDSELWRTTIVSEMITPPTDFIWDCERDMLIGLFAVFPTVDEDGNPDGEAGALGDAECPTTICVYRISDGELLGQVTMDLVFSEFIDISTNSCYGGGRLFFAARDDPFADDRDTANEGNEVYAVEPVTWETEWIDTHGIYGKYTIANMLVDDDGDRLFFQPGKRDPDNNLTLFGNDIIEINLHTGEWKTLLQKGENIAYELEGITPDGSKVCCKELSRDSDGNRNSRPLILDTTTGKKCYYEPTYEFKEFPHYQISLSGNYIIEWSLFKDLWLHDIDTGERKVIAKASDCPAIIPMPGIPGHWNTKY